FAAGFTLATALLHAAGMALGLAAGRRADRGGWCAAQLAGGAMALAGVALLTSAV
ncbi:MAG: HupE/UreJ family protein, partial [Alphaproteobacteria bacterium]|nr:HupE/UreJ family protein [Alphaproteobacteria bacterium]